ncbi:putative WD repeat-containing protein 52 [Penaeus vannamei]|uniref:Putative WD repeat-containing protein 52 n=1 Tax=Penaeus vannamei TaxID=6689 RepID=A0A423TSN9_PENVA|nr:putative WD repeat-containing protein 52 [Penaeus vannamei]
MVSAGGEVRARMGGGGRGGPCHDGPLTDLYLHGSHLYTTGGDGWLRVWEAETLEEAAVTAAGNASHEGWCETGVRTVSLQLVREVLVHVGPGAPVTLIPPSRLTWCVNTDSGVVYGVWARRWAAEVLHQGPSGRVTGVAMATTHTLLAATTQHRYLQVTPLPLSFPPAGVGESAAVPTALAAAPVDGDPTCVSWATCQISGEDDLLVLGLSDGAINVFLLHSSPKDPREKLSLVQVERPHESPVALIATRLKKTAAIEKENGKDENAGEAPLLVTAGEDSRLFIFRLVRVGKVTKLEPVGYYQLLDIPERIKIKSDVIHVETSTGVVFERQLLEEVTESYCAPDAVVLAVPTPDGETIVGVTTRGDVVHLHLSQTKSYSVRLARRQPCPAPSMSRSPTLVLPPGDPCDVQEDVRGASGRRAVVGVSEDGSWAAAWVSGGDLFLYRARGASFPLPQELPAHLRLVGVRGAGGGVAGLSLEQRAQKEAGEKRKAAMEERAALIQQKLSKLKWDFRKLSLR